MRSSAGAPSSSRSTYSSSRSKHSSQRSSGWAGPSSRLMVSSVGLSMIVSPLDRVEGEAPRRQIGAQLPARIVKGLVQRATSRAQPVGKHVERHAVEREGHEDLALVLGQASLYRLADRGHELVRL